MVSRLILAVLIWVTAGSPGVAGSLNLLRNGDFEKSTAGNPALGWNADEQMQAQLVRLDAAEKHSGKHSLAIEIVNGFGRDSYARIEQRVNLRPYRWYVLRAVSRQHYAVPGARLSVTLFKRGGRAESCYARLESRMWAPEEVFFNSQDAMTGVVEVGIPTDSTDLIAVGNTFWLDDISLLELSPDLDIQARAWSATLRDGPNLKDGAIVGSGKGEAIFDFQTLETARYYVWLKWRLLAESRKVALLRIDEGQAHRVAGYTAGSLVWTRCITPTFVLGPGEHRLHIQDLSKDARIHQVCLTPNPFYRPPDAEIAFTEGEQRAAGIRREGFKTTPLETLTLKYEAPYEEDEEKESGKQEKVEGREEKRKEKPPFSATWPFAQGIPIPQGKLNPESGIRLLDKGGNPLLLQTHPLALWPDGSVRWLCVQTLVPVDTSRSDNYTLEYGTFVRRDVPLIEARIDRLKTGVVLESGVLRLRLGLNRFRFAESLRLDYNRDGRYDRREELLDEDAPGGLFVNGEYSSLNAPTSEVIVDEVGPVRAAVKVAGTAVDKNGKPLLDYVVRLYAYAGQSFIRADCTFVARRDRPEAVDLNEVSLRIPLRISARAQVTVGGQDGARHSLLLSDGDVRLLQDGDYNASRRAGSHSYRLWSGKTQAARGTEAPGWIQVSDHYIAVFCGIRDFWQNFPKGYKVSRNAVVAHFVPPRDKPFTFYRGMAKTHEIFLDFTPPGNEAVVAERWKAFKNQPMLSVDPEWIVGTGALGKPGLADPEAFPAYEFRLQEAFGDRAEAMARDRQSHAGLGLIDFGDFRANGGFNNLSTALGEGALMQFIRTGDRRYFDFADIAIRHFSDIDIDHSALRSGGIHQPGPHRRQNAPPPDFGVNGHSWFGGVRDYYYFTGDRRLADLASQVGNYYLARPFSQFPLFHDWAPIAWSAECLLNAYEMTDDLRYLDGVTRIVDVTHYQRDHVAKLPPYTFALGCRSVREYWEKTRDPHAREMFLHLMDAFVAHRNAPDDVAFGVSPKRKGMLLGNYPTPRATNLYNELAWATRLTGNEEYVRLGARDLDIRSKFRLSSDVMLWGSADLIGEMRRLEIAGAKHHANLPWVYCPHEPRMVFQVIEKEDKDFSVGLFVSQKGKHGVNYGGTATLYSPSGGELGKQKVTAGGMNDYAFKVPKDNVKGIYTVVVEIEDFWRWTLDTIHFNLEKGEHILEISSYPEAATAPQEVDKKAKLDCWLLTTDPLYRPHRGETVKQKKQSYFQVEAESGSCIGSMEIRNHAAASGGRFVEDVTGPGGGASVLYRLKIKQPGRYYFHARAGVLSVWNDRLFVNVNRGPFSRFGRIYPVSADPFPRWSLSCSLGPESVVRYWAEPDPDGYASYSSRALRRDGPVR